MKKSYVGLLGLTLTSAVTLSAGASDMYGGGYKGEPAYAAVALPRLVGEHTSLAAVELRFGISEGIGMPLSGHRVLLVEDEAIVAFDVSCIIGRARGSVAGCAANLAEAMRLADLPNLSLAVLDFRLGLETSLPVAAKLHARGLNLGGRL